MGYSRKLECANCYEEHGALHGCLVGVIAGVVQDRLEGVFTEEEVGSVLGPIFANADIDGMWDVIGPVIDDMENAVRRELGKQPGRRPETGERL